METFLKGELSRTVSSAHLMNRVLNLRQFSDTIRTFEYLNMDSGYFYSLLQVDATGSVEVPWMAPDDIGEYVVRVYSVSGLDVSGQAETSVVSRMPVGM